MKILEHLANAKNNSTEIALFRLKDTNFVIRDYIRSQVGTAPHSPYINEESTSTGDCGLCNIMLSQPLLVPVPHLYLVFNSCKVGPISSCNI